jgi:hypothetical protein
MVTEQDLAARVGYRFPGGRYRIEAHVDWLLRDVLGAPQDAGSGLAHPTAAFLAAQGGIGMSIDDVFAVFGASAADGPMLGGWSAEVVEPLRVGADYRVRGSVTGAERKQGRRAGVFDLVTVAIDLLGDDGRVHATVCPTYVFPRRERDR